MKPAPGANTQLEERPSSSAHTQLVDTRPSPKALRIRNTRPRMWAWGKRDQGQCGVPPPAQPEDARKPILDPTPTATAELQGQIVAVTAGEGHSLALDNLGNCYVWGRTREGQAGRVSHVPQHLLGKYSRQQWLALLAQWR